MDVSKVREASDWAILVLQYNPKYRPRQFQVVDDNVQWILIISQIIYNYGLYQYKWYASIVQKYIIIYKKITWNNIYLYVSM